MEPESPVPPLAVGWTPLYPAPRLAEALGLGDLWIKDDGRNPTASFKDRASALAVVKAQEKGADIITTASTGNAAAALAGLCASVAQPSVIFVPASAPQAKVAQLLAYGATVLLVNGSYDDAFELCLQVAEHYGWYNRNTGFNPYMTEGKKTVSFEICEQLTLTPSPSPSGRGEQALTPGSFSSGRGEQALTPGSSSSGRGEQALTPGSSSSGRGESALTPNLSPSGRGEFWEAPDAVFVSVGDGCIIGGVHKGFRDLYELGWIERVPRIYGVQAAGSNYLAEAWERGEDVLTKPPIVADTVADSISAGLPRDRIKALAAVVETGGAFVTVSDDEILAAIPALARGSGVFAEPAGAASYAGLVKAVGQGLVTAADRIVVINTGSGLKDVKSALTAVAQIGTRPYHVEPDLADFERVIQTVNSER